MTREGTESLELKEFSQLSVPENDAGLYVSDGWETVGAPFNDPQSGGRRVMVRRKFRTHAY